MRRINKKEKINITEKKCGQAAQYPELEWRLVIGLRDGEGEAPELSPSMVCSSV